MSGAYGGRVSGRGGQRPLCGVPVLYLIPRNVRPHPNANTSTRRTRPGWYLLQSTPYIYLNLALIGSRHDGTYCVRGGRVGRGGFRVGGTPFCCSTRGFVGVWACLRVLVDPRGAVTRPLGTKPWVGCWFLTFLRALTNTTTYFLVTLLPEWDFVACRDSMTVRVRRCIPRDAPAVDNGRGSLVSM